jgi:iron complex transport system permease protein
MTLLTRRRYFLTLLAFVGFALAAVIVAPHFGAERIDTWGALKAWIRDRDASRLSEEVNILIDLRFPRVVLAFLAGAALGLAGAVFQALLRNPLAEPYTLGVASGGSLGAVLVLFLPGLALRWGCLSTVQVGSFLGASAVVLVIYFMARSRAGISSIALLLAGVTTGFICGAGILLVRYIARPDLLVEMDHWLMGGLDVTGWNPVWSTLPLLIPGAAILLAQARHYDQIAYGEELAAGRGVAVRRLQHVSFFGGSLLTASVVATTGPIGFVGLLVPHAIRRLIGPDHRLLLPCSFFGAGAFLVICDTFARSISLQLPVGILTTLLGGPFFLYLLIRSRGRWGKGTMA